MKLRLSDCQQSLPRGVGRWVGRWVGLGAVCGLGAAIAGAILLACQAQAGMFCQQQSECRVGLICQKPPGTDTDNSFGVCEPARRGIGEPCLSSEDCQSGLRCSNEDGIDNGDERHGICQTVATPDSGTQVDMGAADQ